MEKINYSNKIFQGLNQEQQIRFMTVYEKYPEFGEMLWGERIDDACALIEEAGRNGDVEPDEEIILKELINGA
jgi:hypothetical protein